MVQLRFRGVRGFLRAHGGLRHLPGHEALVTANYETREHDVLIIGAGGAGLRAALEALAQGASVGVVCKSLLGKAHTVMAEGGLAPRKAKVNPPNNCKKHFHSTMTADKY